MAGKLKAERLMALPGGLVGFSRALNDSVQAFAKSGIRVVGRGFADNFVQAQLIIGTAVRLHRVAQAF